MPPRPLRPPLAAVLAVALLAWAAPAQACSVCGCGDPLLTSSDPAAINGQLRLQLDTEYLRVDAGTDGVPGSTDQLSQWSTRLDYEEGDWSAIASLSYRVRTEARYFDATRYKFGDALLWSVHGQWLATRRLALDLGLDGRRAAADRATDEAGVVDGHVVNTGGTVLSASPAVYFNASGALWLFARGQVPVVKRLDGEQDVKPSVTAGLQVQL